MITTDNPNARRPVLDSHGMVDTRYNDQTNALDPVVSTTAQCGDLPHSAFALRMSVSFSIQWFQRFSKLPVMAPSLLKVT